MSAIASSAHVASGSFGGSTEDLSKLVRRREIDPLHIMVSEITWQLVHACAAEARGTR